MSCSHSYKKSTLSQPLNGLGKINKKKKKRKSKKKEKRRGVPLARKGMITTVEFNKS